MQRASRQSLVLTGLVHLTCRHDHHVNNPAPLLLIAPSSLVNMSYICATPCATEPITRKRWLIFPLDGGLMEGV